MPSLSGLFARFVGRLHWPEEVERELDRRFWRWLDRPATLNDRRTRGRKASGPRRAQACARRKRGVGHGEDAAQCGRRFQGEKARHALIERHARRRARVAPLWPLFFGERILRSVDTIDSRYRILDNRIIIQSCV
jgi:uncharacterized membrane protein YccC